MAKIRTAPAPSKGPAKRSVRPGLPRAARFVQMGLVVVAAFLLLSWYEDGGLGGAQAAEDVVVGEERVWLTYEAPVTTPRGPWSADDVFTEKHPGVPLTVAPRVQVIAHHGGDTPVEDATWRARVLLREQYDGKTWWEVEEPVEVTIQEGTGVMDLDLQALTARAAALDEAAEVAGVITIELRATHEATVLHRGEEILSSRTAVAIAKLEGEVASIQLSPDTATYYAPAPPAGGPEPPTMALGMLAAVVVVEPFARRAARAVPYWRRAPGVTILDVHRLRVPTGTPWSDMETALKTARKTGQPLLVDEHARICLVEGEVRVAASLPDASEEGPEKPVPPAPGREPEAPEEADAPPETAPGPGADHAPDLLPIPPLDGTTLRTLFSPDEGDRPARRRPPRPRRRQTKRGRAAKPLRGRWGLRR